MGYFHLLTENQLKIAIDVLISITITVVFIKLITTFISSIFKKIIKPFEDTDIIKRLKTIKVVLISTINCLIVAFLLLHLLDIFGINIKPILATAGLLGIAITLGAQKTIEDVISGLSLIFEGQLRVGDVVKIQDITGSVEKINLRFVMLRDIEGAVHYFKNSTVSPLTNYSKDFSYAVLDIGVAYKENISYVMDVIKEVGNDLKNDTEVGEFITSDVQILGLEKFEDSQVVIKFRIKTLPSRQWLVTRAYNLRIKNKFDELNIEIPFSQRVITNI